MKKLFVHKSVTINAGAAKIWETLTRPELTRYWLGEFGIDGHVHSDWRFGSEVLWKEKSGRARVRGNVIILEPYELLRFTAIDKRMEEKTPPSSEDGVTYEFSEKSGGVELAVRHGNFAKAKNGEKFYRTAAEAWERALAKIKRISEH